MIADWDSTMPARKTIKHGTTLRLDQEESNGPSPDQTPMVPKIRPIAKKSTYLFDESFN
jgi:hypothetical protein